MDEIGTMPLEMQAKLLRVLEEREFERVGGHNKVEVDVRVISATNEDLRSLVSKKSFERTYTIAWKLLVLNSTT